MTARAYVTWLVLVVVGPGGGARAFAETPPAFVPPAALPAPAGAPGASSAAAAGWFQDGTPIPPGYHWESRVRRDMVWSGAGVFAFFYGMSLRAHNNPGGNWVFIPLAGPILYARHSQCAAPCDDIGTPLFAYLFTGTEALGLGLMASGFIFQNQWLVADQPRIGVAPRRTIAFLPWLDHSGASLAAVGTF